MNRSCSWEDICPIAEKLTCEIDGESYYVWVAPRELPWAEKAWNALSRKGLTTYGNPCDKSYVQLQILTLAAMFCKYLEIAFDSAVVIPYHEWFEDTGIAPAHLETIAGEELTTVIEDSITYLIPYNPIEYEFEEFEEKEEESFTVDKELDPDKVVEAIKEVIRLQRPHIFNALLQEFSGPSLLYVSLLQTSFHKNCLEWIEGGMTAMCDAMDQRFC